MLNKGEYYLHPILTFILCRFVLFFGHVKFCLVLFCVFRFVWLSLIYLRQNDDVNDFGGRNNSVNFTLQHNVFLINI
jgi:hypothetical protein